MNCDAIKCRLSTPLILQHVYLGATLSRHLFFVFRIENVSIHNFTLVLSQGANWKFSIKDRKNTKLSKVLIFINFLQLFITNASVRIDQTKFTSHRMLENETIQVFLMLYQLWKYGVQGCVNASSYFRTMTLC